MHTKKLTGKERSAVSVARAAPSSMLHANCTAKENQSTHAMRLGQRKPRELPISLKPCYIARKPHSLERHLHHVDDGDDEVGEVDGILPAAVLAMVRL